MVQVGESLWRLANVAALPFLVLVGWQMAVGPGGPDDLAYWLTRSGPLYDLPWNVVHGAYIYSPAFAQAIGPLVALPYHDFHALLVVVQVAALAWLVGPAGGLVFLFIPQLGPVDVANGNINVLLAAALALGAWPAILLTKLSPAIGLAWYAVRREWRPLGIALGLTGAIALVSFVLLPGAWPQWFGALEVATHSPLKGVPVPLLVRVPIAGLIAAWAGLTDRTWPLALSAWLAMPDFGLSGAAWLLAIPRLASRSR